MNILTLSPCLFFKSLIFFSLYYTLIFQELLLIPLAIMLAFGQQSRNIATDLLSNQKGLTRLKERLCGWISWFSSPFPWLEYCKLVASPPAYPPPYLRQKKSTYHFLLIIAGLLFHWGLNTWVLWISLVRRWKFHSFKAHGYIRFSDYKPVRCRLIQTRVTKKLFFVLFCQLYYLAQVKRQVTTL